MNAQIRQKLNEIADEYNVPRLRFIKQYNGDDVYSPDFPEGAKTGLPIYFIVSDNTIKKIGGADALRLMLEMFPDDENAADSSMSFDSAPSQRRKDENGFMHVNASHITKEQVVKYYGREIPGWQELKLDPERLYNVYRPADEIEKAAPTFDGLPLLLQHHLESADEPQKAFRVGSISRPVWNAPYLDCDLHITDGAAIDAIEHGDFKEISAAYLYDPVLERGSFDGDDYEIVMRNLRGNHVALVEKGRAGADVVVADSAPRILRSFAAWVRRNPLALKDTPTEAWENTKAAMDDAWITVHPNSGAGRPVLLGDDGTIKAGMGGKFNGQRIDLIPRKPKTTPTGSETIKTPTVQISRPKTAGGASRYSKIGQSYAERRQIAFNKVLSDIGDPDMNKKSDEELFALTRRADDETTRIFEEKRNTEEYKAINKLASDLNNIEREISTVRGVSRRPRPLSPEQVQKIKGLEEQGKKIQNEIAKLGDSALFKQMDEESKLWDQVGRSAEIYLREKRNRFIDVNPITGERSMR